LRAFRTSFRFALALTLARIKGGSSWKAHALGGLVRTQGKAGDERGALAVAAEQTSPALKVRALLGVAKGRAKPPTEGHQPPERR
jgi:hypothetical protein